MTKLASLILAVCAAACGMSSAEASIRRDVVAAHSSEYFTYHADPGETFDVDLSGDGSSDLDLLVRSPGGTLVCQEVSRFDDESCRVYSPRGGTYRIEVRNVGSVWNDFRVSAY